MATDVVGKKSTFREKWPRSHPVRKISRECLAAVFWIHALYAFNLWHIPGYTITRYLYNFSLVAFILYYSYLSENGWLSVAFDVLFVYFWPFVVTGRVAWRSIKLFLKIVSKNTRVPKASLIVDSALPPNVVSPVPEIAADSPKNSELSKEAEKGRSVKSLTKLLFQPMLRFSILWATLIFTIDNPYLIYFASGLALIGAGRAIWNLTDLLGDSSEWIKKLKGTLAIQTANQIAQISGWNAEEDPAGIKPTANVLKILEFTFRFLSENRSFFATCVSIASMAISIPFYLYVSYLFSCVYFGLSKIEHIQWRWIEAFCDSLYMPFAFTDLPHSVIIRLIAGLQGIAVTVIGWNIFSRHLGDHLDKLVNAAVELRVPFDNELFKKQIVLIEQVSAKADAQKVASVKVAHSEVPTSTPLPQA